jgi:hypothetical protein
MDEDKNKSIDENIDEFDIEFGDLSGIAPSAKAGSAMPSPAGGINPDPDEEEEKESLREEAGIISSEHLGEKEGDDGFVSIPRAKLHIMKMLAAGIIANSEQLNNLLSAYFKDEELPRLRISQRTGEERAQADGEDGDEKVIEGIFDGEKMIGPDGKQYIVPANYASKSKLVEGDLLKLTITRGGTFLFKQIGPIERARETGELEKDATGACYVISGIRRWRVLPASITYFRGEPGDEVIVLVPKEGESRWAAVENVVKKS